MAADLELKAKVPTNFSAPYGKSIPNVWEKQCLRPAAASALKWLYPHTQQRFARTQGDQGFGFSMSTCLGKKGKLVGPHDPTPKTKGPLEKK